jgi:hypothetical protein
LNTPQKKHGNGLMDGDGRTSQPPAQKRMTDDEIISALLTMADAHAQGEAILREAAARIRKLSDELTAAISGELSAFYERNMP